MKNLINYIKQNPSKICYIIILISAILKLTSVFLLPYFISEDTFSYVTAAKYLMTGDLEYRAYFAYRQLFYPGFIATVQHFAGSNTFVTIAIIQSLISTLSVYLLFLMARRLKWNSFFTIFFVGFVAFNTRLFFYSQIVVTETFVVFFLVLAFYSTQRLASIISNSEKEKTKTFAFFSFTLTMAGLGAVNTKELFIFAILLSYAFLLFWVIRRFQFKYFSSIMISIAIFVGGIALSLQKSRELMHSDMTRPYCNPWAVPAACHLMQLDTPLYQDFKQRVRGYVTERRQLLSNWDYQWAYHDVKGNICNDESFMVEIMKYTQDVTGKKDKYDNRCDAEVISRDLYIEALKAEPKFIFTHWVYPEMLHGFFNNTTKPIGSIDFRTYREQNDYFGQFANEVRPGARWGEPEFREFLYLVLWGENRSVPGFVFLALVLVNIIMFRKVRFEFENSFSIMMACHTLGYVLVITVLNYFYERYFAYFDFASMMFILHQLNVFIEKGHFKKFSQRE